MKRSEIFFTILLLPIDFIALMAAFIFSYFLRDKLAHNPETLTKLSQIFQFDPVAQLPSFNSYWHFSVFLTLLFIVIFALSGLYIIRTAHLGFREFPKIIYAVSAAISAVILISFFLRVFLLPRLLILFVWIFAILFVGIGRLIIRLIQRNLFRLNIGVIRVGVLGNNQTAYNAEKQIKNLKLRGFILQRTYKVSEIGQAKKDMQKHEIDQIIISDQSISDESLKDMHEYSIDHHIKFSYIPSLFELSTSARTTVRDLYGFPIVEIKTTPLDGWGRVFKRLFDIVFSLLAIIILSPVFLIVVIVHKIIMPGPLLFKHKRIGIGGRELSIYKFRSIKVGWNDNDVIDGQTGLERLQEYLAKHPAANKEWQATQKLKRDPRTTKFGVFLRKSNLDELPQFFNILFGDISLVGPRPIVQSELDKFGSKAGRIFSVKPGLTGLWQVLGRNDLSYEDRVRLNVYYVENWSFWLDLQILLRTPFVVLSRKNVA